MNWKIEPTKSLTEVAVERIRAAIIDGRLALGEKLSEQKLAQLFEISRSPVRDALAILQSEGLVNVYPKRGSFVFSPILDEVRDLCEFRTILEVAAIEIGIKKNSDHLIRELKQHIRRMQEAQDGKRPSDYAQQDAAFHRAIVASSSNKSLILAHDRMIGPVLALRNHLFVVMNEVFERSMTDHVQLVDMCQEKNFEGAETILRAHIGHVLTAFVSAEKTMRSN